MSAPVEENEESSFLGVNARNRYEFDAILCSDVDIEISLRRIASRHRLQHNQSLNDRQISRLVSLSKTANTCSREANNLIFSHNLTSVSSSMNSRLWKRRSDISDHQFDEEAKTLASLLTTTLSTSHTENILDRWFDVDNLCHRKRSRYCFMEANRVLNNSQESSFVIDDRESSSDGAINLGSEEACSQLTSTINMHRDLTKVWSKDPISFNVDVTRWLSKVIEFPVYLHQLIDLPFTSKDEFLCYINRSELHSTLNQRLHYEIKTKACIDSCQREELVPKLLRVLTFVNFKFFECLSEHSIEVDHQNISQLMAVYSNTEVEMCKLFMNINTINFFQRFQPSNNMEDETLVNLWLLRIKFPCLFVEALFNMFGMLKEKQDGFDMFLISWWSPMAKLQSSHCVKLRELINEVNQKVSAHGVWSCLCDEKHVCPVIQLFTLTGCEFGLVTLLIVAISDGIDVQKAWEKYCELVNVTWSLCCGLVYHMEHVLAWLKVRGRRLLSSDSMSLSAAIKSMVDLLAEKALSLNCNKKERDTLLDHLQHLKSLL